MLKSFTACMILFLPFAGLLAQTPAAKILPFLDDKSFMLARVLPSKINISKILTVLVQKKVISPPEAFAYGLLLTFQKANIDRVVEEIWLVSGHQNITTYFFPSIIIKTKPNVNTEDLLNLLKSMPLPFNLITLSGQQIKKVPDSVFTVSLVLKEDRGFYLLDHVNRAKPEGPFSQAEIAKVFDTMGTLPLSAMFFSSKRNPFDLGKIFPSLKKNEATKPDANQFANGIKLITLGTHIEPWKIQMMIQTKEKAIANDLFKEILKMIQLVPDLVKSQVEEVGKDPVLNALAALVKSVTLEEDKVHILIEDFEPYFEIGAKIAEQKQATASAAFSLGQVKNIANALLQYQKEKGKFPPHATRSNDGKPLLSWRVQILPYLGNNLLYKQFRQNEPWDSDHNKKLIRRIPPAFRDSANGQEIGTTSFLAPIADATLFPSKGQGTSLKQITNDVSKTILFLQVPPDKAVVWTKPEDWEVDFNLQGNDLLKGFTNVIVFACADGSAKTIALKDAYEKIKPMLAIGGP